MATHLEPSLPANTSLNSSLSSRANTIAIYPSITSSLTTSNKNSNSTIIYFSQYELNLLQESREFLIETYTLFISLQKIAKANGGDEDDYRPNSFDPVGPLQVQYYSRISKLYREVIVKQFKIIEANPELDDKAKSNSLNHHATLHSVLSLAEILYLPADGSGDGLVGEEILDWVNTVDRAPSAEEGEQLADLSRPWEHPNFWPYIYRCILRAHLLSVTALLQLVLTHPSLFVQSLATHSLSVLTTFPRSTSFTSEPAFLTALTAWKSKLKRTVSEMEIIYKGEAENDSILGGRENDEERLDWEAGFSIMMQLISGKEKKILEACEDWREALGAWGIWVNAGGRREGLPETIARITKHLPVDSTLPVESVQASLILGDVPRALQQSNLLSLWLVSHLADLLQKVSVIELPSPSSTSSPSPISLRDHFVLSYTDSLLSDPSLWRVTVDYLSTCGEQGLVRMKQVLKSVDLSEEVLVVEGKGMDVVEEQGTESKRKSKVVDDVLRVCAEQGLDDVLKGVCKVYSEQLISQKRYGEAVSYVVRAGDGKRIARITERVLEEYIINGQEAFIHHVDSIPTSLLRPSTSPLNFNQNNGSSSSLMDEDDQIDDLPLLLTPYSSRLSFLARYRDFFALYARGERKQAATLLVLLFSSNVAPKSFYAVMLLDVVPLLEGDELVITTSETYELLRCLEEITSNISTSGDIYGHLNSLARIVSGGNESSTKKDREVQALKQLEVVRGALARHLGRCFAKGV